MRCGDREAATSHRARFALGPGAVDRDIDMSVRLAEVRRCRRADQVLSTATSTCPSGASGGPDHGTRWRTRDGRQDRPRETGGDGPDPETLLDRAEAHLLDAGITPR